jgi:O-antigen ligase
MSLQVGLEGRTRLPAWEVAAGIAAIGLPAAAFLLGVWVETALALIGVVLALGVFLVSLRWAWGPAVIAVAVAPFQGFLIARLGIAANLFTLVPVGATLWMTRSAWGEYLLRSRAQKLAALFVIALLVGLPVAAANGFDATDAVDYSQKVALFFLLGALALAFRSERGLRIVAGTLVLSTVALFALSTISFYLHISIPWVSDAGTAVSGIPPASAAAATSLARLSGLEESVGPNRLALWGILPLCLAFWFLLSGRLRHGLLGALGVAAIGAGVLATGSRSGVLGLAAALTVLILMWPSQAKIRVIFLAGLTALSALWVVTSSGGQPILDRLIADDPAGVDGRIEVWRYGFQLFLTHPLTGVGPGGFAESFSNTALYSATPSLADPHSAFIEVISQRGFIAALLLLLLMTSVVRTLMKPGGTAASRRWTAVMLAAFLGMLVSCVFNSYLYERVVWVPVAYAAALESLRRVSASPASEHATEPTALPAN